MHLHVYNSLFFKHEHSRVTSYIPAAHFEQMHSYTLSQQDDYSIGVGSNFTLRGLTQLSHNNILHLAIPYSGKIL